MAEQNNIRVIFTTEANLALADIIKNYNLEETAEEFLKKTKAKKFSNEVIIDHLAKDFAIGKISEKDLTDSLQKDLEVSQQIAEQISKEIITKIIPFLEKVPEEKLQDPAFAEELERKIFGTTNENPPVGAEQIKKEKDIDLFPKIKPPTNTEPNIIIEKPARIAVPSVRGEEPKGKSTLPSKRTKKSIVEEKTKEPMPQPKQPRGPDNYREPIE